MNWQALSTKALTDLRTSLAKLPSRRWPRNQENVDQTIKAIDAVLQERDLPTRED
jgi:hypothetical protein